MGMKLQLKGVGGDWKDHGKRKAFFVIPRAEQATWFSVLKTQQRGLKLLI